MSDEFETIARLFRPLTQGAAEAFGLQDDAAAIPSRSGFDLVVTTDAMVAGVHFLPNDPLDLVARKLLRVNLSDLAAKGAEPYAYFLTLAWPHGTTDAEKTIFAQGLAEDQAAFGVRLLGGDTVSTSGPLTVSATLLGWVPARTMVRRSGAHPGEVVLATGSIGDGALGLKAARGALGELAETAKDKLQTRYRLPQPRLGWGEALRRSASAAADVSDGLIADIGHLAEASGVAIELDLERVPLSVPARTWIEAQPDPTAALIELATGGDDYEIVCTASLDGAAELALACAREGVELTPVGRVLQGQGLGVLYRGQPVAVARRGWTHG